MMKIPTGKKYRVKNGEIKMAFRAPFHEIFFQPNRQLVPFRRPDSLAVFQNSAEYSRVAFGNQRVDKDESAANRIF
jgi:hypothetical protein